jgi:uncharacterized protein YndB with AHSA1/START domain
MLRFVWPCLLLATAALGDVTESGPSAFVVKLKRTVAAPPLKVWQAMLKPAAWWGVEHTFTGDTKNLYLDARIGGCFCEKVSGGGVQHLQVVSALPNKMLVMVGGLGPLQQSGVSGAMTWSLAERDGKTEISWVYDVGGHYTGGLDQMSAKVDHVLAEQLDRLVRLVETGSPREAKAAAPAPAPAPAAGAARKP